MDPLTPIVRMKVIEDSVEMVHNLPYVKDNCVHILDEMLWMCNNCPALFRNETQLNEHGESVHQFWCPYCANVHFYCKDDFIQHYSSASHLEEAKHVTIVYPTGLQSAQFSCQTCNTKCADLKALERHVATHKGCTRLRCNCYAAFGDIQKLAAHFESHKNDEKSDSVLKKHTVNCEVCNKQFTVEELLLNHYEMEHKLEVDSFGSKNEQMTGQKRKLTVLEDSDMVNLDSSSDYEPGKTKSVSKKKTVRIKVTRKRKKTKNSCKSFVIGQIDDLKPPRISCSQCPKTFKNQLMVNKHEADEHSDSNPVDHSHSRRTVVSCSVCGMAMQRQSLNRHIRSCHENERNYSCTHCEKAFKTSTALKYHVDSDHSSMQICTVCEQAFKNKVSLVKHVKLKHGGCQFLCLTCDVRHDSSSDLAEHLVLVHTEGDEPLQCQLCDFNFTEKAHFLQHYEALHLIKTEEFQCEECNKVFDTRNKLSRHNFNVHVKGTLGLTDEVNENVKHCCVANCRMPLSDQSAVRYYELCDVTGIREAWADAIRNEFPDFTPDVSDVICQYHFSKEDFEEGELLAVRGDAVPTIFVAFSNKKFKRTRSWRRPVHPDELKYDQSTDEKWLEKGCQICQKQFFFRKQYVQHMDLVHSMHVNPIKSSLPTIVCEICGVEIQGNTCYRDHLAKHANLRQYKCNECEKSFFSNANLSSHRQSAHAERIICTICGNEFRSKAGHRYHMASTHFNAETDTKYPCKVCGKEFKLEYQLRKHYNTRHLNQRPPYKECTQCKKSFREQRDLDDHVNAYHSKERMFGCALCDKQYTQMRHLRKHSKKMHQVWINNLNMGEYVKVLPWSIISR